MKINKTIILGMILMLSACSQPVNTKVSHPSSTSVEKFKSDIADGIVVVDFFGTWCGPCKRFAPTFVKVSDAYPNMTFIKVDIDQYREIAKAYGVRSLPTLVMFKGGTKVATQVGAMSEIDFKAWINKWAKKQSSLSKFHKKGKA